MLKPKTYVLLVAAIEEGVAHGLRRAFEYRDSPDEQALADMAEVLEQEVLNAIVERFRLEEEG